MSGQAGEWGGEEGGHTMVKVLCSQRDRFKDRANQLELQLAQVVVTLNFIVFHAASVTSVLFSACSAANTLSSFPRPLFAIPKL